MAFSPIFDRAMGFSAADDEDDSDDDGAWWWRWRMLDASAVSGSKSPMIMMKAPGHRIRKTMTSTEEIVLAVA